MRRISLMVTLSILVLLVLGIFFTGSSAEAATLSMAKFVYETNEAVTVQFADFPGNSSDWITIVPSGTPDDSFNERHYTNGVVNGTMNFQGLPTGSYEVRAYFDWEKTGTYIVQTRLCFVVESEKVSTLVHCSGYVYTEKNVYSSSESIVVFFVGFPGNPSDWITIVPNGTADSSFNEWYYTKGAINGTLKFNGLPAGRYEVRAYFNGAKTGTYMVQARYNFIVENDWVAIPEQLSKYVWPEKNIYAAEEPIVIRFTGFPGNPSDWITIVPIGTPENIYNEWYYTNGKKEGSMRFRGLAPGTYEVRCYFNWNSNGTYIIQGSYRFVVR